MRFARNLSRLVVVLAFAQPAVAQQGVSGDWMLTAQESFGPLVMRLSLTQTGEKLVGMSGGRPLEGTVKGNAINFKIDDAALKAMLDAKAVLADGELRGETVLPDRTVQWTAVRIPSRPARPKKHDFEPTEFHLYFSSKPKPVLRVHPGDTVRTWSVDAGGRDKSGNRRSGGGNPETGPFYVEGAVPGDTLVVRIDKVRLNRDWAGSGNSIMRNALEPGTVANAKWDNQFPNRWKLDTAKGVAYLEKPSEALKNFTVPLAPMLGCIGVAPPGEWSIRATDSGRFGGNMDYNQIREGTTVYLPVNHPGALLFLGDGHAAQGDGELTGDALETSMDFEFTVDLIPDKSFGHPLVETAEFLISLGIGGSLDQALQQATSGMVRWLERDYGLSANEAAMLLGFAVRYDIVDLVGTQSTLAQLTKRAA
jgi:amidase